MQQTAHGQDFLLNETTLFADLGLLQAKLLNSLAQARSAIFVMLVLMDMLS